MPHDAIFRIAREYTGTDEAVIATDASGSIVFWNDRAELLYGWTGPETLGRNIVDVLATRNNADEGALIMEEFRRGRMVDGEFIAQRRDGSPIMIYVRNLPVLDGEKVIGIVGVSRATARSA
jgi:PAS domain S-box-containing protein